VVRGERLIKFGYIWFFAKPILVGGFKNINFAGKALVFFKRLILGLKLIKLVNSKKIVKFSDMER